MSSYLELVTVVVVVVVLVLVVALSSAGWMMMRLSVRCSVSKKYFLNYEAEKIFYNNNIRNLE